MLLSLCITIFYDFYLFSAKKCAFFLQTNVMILFLPSDFPRKQMYEYRPYGRQSMSMVGTWLEENDGFQASAFGDVGRNLPESAHDLL
jgi:hypothetical protein